MFERLKKFKLRLNVHKCEFEKTEITFLGYLINQEGCRPTNDRVQAIMQFPKSQTVVQLRRFLGMINFYRRNIPRAAEVQAPLNVYLTDVKKNDKREIPSRNSCRHAGFNNLALYRVGRDGRFQACYADLYRP